MDVGGVSVWCAFCYTHSLVGVMWRFGLVLSAVVKTPLKISGILCIFILRNTVNTEDIILVIIELYKIFHLLYKFVERCVL